MTDSTGYCALLLVILCGGCNSGVPSVCASLPITASELTKGSARDKNIELLALNLSPGIFPDEEVYKRLLRDITAVRAMTPAISHIQYFPPAVGLRVEFTGTDLGSVDAEEWSCINQYFRVRGIDSATGAATMTFEGGLKLEEVAKYYRRLRGVLASEPIHPLGGGPTIYVTPDVEAWHYVFDDARGDCPAGCTEHELHYFLVGASGNPEAIGTWDLDSTEERPVWVDKYWQQTRLRWRSASKQD